MATATATRVLEHRTADEVWGRIGNFADPDWLAGVTRLEIHGSGPGAVRVVGVPGGVKLTETLVEQGDRSLTWKMADGSPLPVKNYVATLTVAETPEGKASVTWTSTFDSAGPPEAMLEQMLASMQTDMLAGL